MLSRQTPVNLCFQDKYILAFDRSDLPFNSHLIVEHDGDLDADRILLTLKKYYQLDEITRIVPDLQTGKFYLQEYNEKKVDNSFQKLENENNVWSEAFNFESSYGVKITLLPNKIIFTFHHSLYDGHAQFNWLKDFLDLYTDNDFIPRTKNDVFKFRKYFLDTKIPWIVDFFKSGLVPAKKKKDRKKVKIARLVDQEPSSRSVSVKTLEFDRALLDKQSRKATLSFSAYVALVGAKAMDKTLRDRNENENPIVLYITKSMRFELKAMRALQNLVGFIWMKIDREKLHSDEYGKFFRDTYKFRSSEGEIKKTLLAAGLIVKLCSFKKLKQMLEAKEKKVHDCTLIVSSGRTPAEIIFPENWKVKSILARGTMHRSPGIGLMVTSYKAKDFLTVEYLTDAFSEATIETFCNHLSNLINQA